MRAVDIIAKKRDGRELSRDELGFVIKAYTSGELADYQMSALLMAIYLRGMTRGET
ncbi:MAG TPA: pyrimidine-nucleoside phosphorylase, partial [Blastocatellia bacterium]|nr:pyrimidine-nucleoside phosphorylase [Blastocatellia bacterium]